MGLILDRVHGSVCDCDCVTKIRTLDQDPRITVIRVGAWLVPLSGQEVDSMGTSEF